MRGQRSGPGASRLRLPVGPGPGDAGSGVLGTALGLLVVVLAVLLMAQVLVRLHATTTLRAVLLDAVSLAASDAATSGGTDGVSLDHFALEARRSLGGLGDGAEVNLEARDTDGDGAPDVIVGRARADAPGLLPAAAGLVGAGQIRAGAQVRIERFR